MELNSDKEPESVDTQLTDLRDSNPDPPEIQIDQEKWDKYVASLLPEQNFGGGLLKAGIAALVGAALWATITVTTHFQIGYMAVAVGFLVGHAMRIGGNGIEKKFGYAGAILALVGCILGNFFTLVGFVAKEAGAGFFETLGVVNYLAVPQAMIEFGSPMDLLFYGIALYEGYHFSFRKFTEEEVLEHAAVPTETTSEEV